MNIKNISLSIIVFMIIIGSGYLFFKDKRIDQMRTTSPLIIGTASGYAPFVSINEQGEYEGFDIDVAKALAKKMGKELEIKDLGSMAPLFMALDQGSVDIVIWGLSIIQSRLDKVAMVRYMGEDITSLPLIFWQKIPDNVTSINDMANMTVCIEPGSSEEVILDKYPFINKLPTEKIDDALLNVQYGKANAALVEPAIAKKFKNKYPEIQILDVPLESEDQVHGIGIAIKRDNMILIKKITDAINELIHEGIIDQYKKKWNL